MRKIITRIIYMIVITIGLLFSLKLSASESRNDFETRIIVKDRQGETIKNMSFGPEESEPFRIWKFSCQVGKLSPGADQILSRAVMCVRSISDQMIGFGFEVQCTSFDSSPTLVWFFLNNQGEIIRKVFSRCEF